MEKSKHARPFIIISVLLEGLIGIATISKNGLLNRLESYVIKDLGDVESNFLFKVLEVPIYNRSLFFIRYGNNVNINYNTDLICINNRGTDVPNIYGIKIGGEDKLYYKYDGNKTVCIYAKINSGWSSVELVCLMNSNTINIIMSRDDSVSEQSLKIFPDLINQN